ncbi:MAG: YhcH/YjgK/YiaL family protein [Bacteroidaceae bacterium]|nr:YhcH/YjgK/YiaL family protein [Bacteroidaceae bacterium]
MIIDTLENLGKYASINPLFKKVADYIANNDINSHEPGKVEIDGKDLFVNYAVAKGKTKEEAKLESHNIMIDIQIPLSCPETMGYTPRKEMEEAEYNAEKDITFYKGLAKDYVTIFPGSFVIFFPQDLHAPCISDNKEIKKVIFKVKNL